MKKERLFYLDFIRAFAAIAIIITHYNAVYLYLPTPAPEKMFLTARVSNIYIGDLGSALFFIISGAALMYVYSDRCDLKQYYKKRFLSIYPMFWMAWVIDVLIRAYLDGGIDHTIPKWKIVYSICGMDQYLAEVVHPFLYVGEWFLGCIILMYLLFPLLRWATMNKPLILSISTMALFVLALVFDGGTFPIGKNIFVHLPKFIFGMLFIHWIKKVKVPVLIAAVVVAAANTIVAPRSISQIVQALYVGIAYFLILAFLSEYIQKKPQEREKKNMLSVFFKAIRYFCMVISKYSYAIFLVHHVIILRLVRRIDLNTITRTDSYLLFFFCVLCIAIAAKAVYSLHAGMMKIVDRIRMEEE